MYNQDVQIVCIPLDCCRMVQPFSSVTIISKADDTMRRHFVLGSLVMVWGDTVVALDSSELSGFGARCPLDDKKWEASSC